MVKKTYIRSLKRNFPTLKIGNNYYFAVPLEGDIVDIAFKVGFTKDLNIGETILPSAEFGRVSKFNAEGKEVINKSKGKEVRSYTRLWTRKEFRGRYRKEEVTDFVTIPRKIWHRDYIQPPEINLQIIEGMDNKKFISSPLFEYIPDSTSSILHIANLFLEIFGMCDILNNDKSPTIKSKLHNLNFTILPPGESPFDRRYQEEFARRYNLSEAQKQLNIQRSEILSRYKPQNIYQGLGGYSGYFISEYTDKRLLIVENFRYGNATYVFNDTYESINFEGLTKKKIIDEKLHKERLIHTKGWENKIAEYLE
ncbi:MAG: hypothetical protein K0R14_791 [Burkholderiales bacterium]|jgi:hypothetical protein|nr:hypothetical protein [Burkholderiales bacterium]